MMRLAACRPDNFQLASDAPLIFDREVLRGSASLLQDATLYHSLVHSYRL